MDFSSIKTGLEGFVERYDSQTFIGSYKETSRSSLLKDGLSTRANSLWKMAEYVVAQTDNKDVPISDYINGWKQLAFSAANQYLLLEEYSGSWGIYDYKGYRLGGNDYISDLFLKKKKEKNSSVKSETSINKCINDGLPSQLIYYGAPGTGKSHEIKERTNGQSVIRTTFHPDTDYSTFVGAYKPTMEETDALVVPVVVDKGISLEDTKNYKGKRITYKFVKQAFLKAYLLAWKNYTDLKTVTTITDNSSTDKILNAKQEIITNAIQNDFNPYNNIKPDENPNQSDQDEHTTSKSKLVVTNSCKPVFLIIEEINRGNCAQIFGDLFQLLDRGNNGFSEYPIEADDDLRQEIERAFREEDDYKLVNNINVEGAVMDYTSNYGATLSEDIQHGRILLLPKNLHIWATMNTSDQSLFPIDSAFKRRWDWEYVRICEGKKKDGTPLNYRIKFDVPGEEEPVDVPWWDFVRAINKQIEDATKSEDKKLGYFFCKPDKKANDADECNTVISAETFVGKVVFYLWQDVFKDYGFKSDIFKREDGTKISFHDFYPEDMVADKELNPKGIDLMLVKEFINKVVPINK